MSDEVFLYDMVRWRVDRLLAAAQVKHDRALFFVARREIRRWVEAHGDSEMAKKLGLELLRRVDQVYFQSEGI
jgi:hypothetical protein